MLQNKDRAAELSKLGFKGVPVVAVGEQAVHGVDLQAVAHLLDISYDAQPALSPEQLKTRLDYFLHWLIDYIGVLPSNLETLTIPGRDRSLWEIAEHVAELSRVYQTVAMEHASFDASAANATPEQSFTREELVALLRRLCSRFLAEQAEYDREVDTYFGRATLHAILERTTWHTAQHLRQLESLLLENSSAQHRLLDQTQFEELPMPAEVWD